MEHHFTTGFLLFHFKVKTKLGDSPLEIFFLKKEKTKTNKKNPLITKETSKIPICSQISLTYLMAFPPFSFSIFQGECNN